MLPKSTADLPRLLHPVPPEIRTNSKVLIELIRRACEVEDMKEKTLMSIYNEVCGVQEKEEEGGKKEGDNHF